MWEVVGLRTAIGQYLISADSDRADIFTVSGIFAYHFRWNIGLVPYFGNPLAYSYCVWRENERCPLDIRHCSQSNNSFACAARQNDDATAAAGCAIGIECRCRCILIVAR